MKDKRSVMRYHGRLFEYPVDALMHKSQTNRALLAGTMEAAWSEVGTLQGRCRAAVHPASAKRPVVSKGDKGGAGGPSKAK